MDNELQELEAELQRLRPVASSEFLAARVGRELESRRSFRWSWLALPAAAAVIGLIAFRPHPAETAVAVAKPAAIQSPVRYKPVSAENVLYDHRDEGIVTLADGTTARRVRNSYVDTITWKDPRTQASLRWSVPRTEERVVPVNFQ